LSIIPRPRMSGAVAVKLVRGCPAGTPLDDMRLDKLLDKLDDR
jgi:hypothetical protein